MEKELVEKIKRGEEIVAATVDYSEWRDWLDSNYPLLAWVELRGSTGGWDTIYIYRWGSYGYIELDDTHDGYAVLNAYRTSATLEQIIDAYSRATDDKDGYHIVEVRYV